MNFSFQSLFALIQAIMAALNALQQKGKQPDQAMHEVADHVTPGKPNSRDLT